MIVPFVKWSLAESDRLPIGVNPKDVIAVEFFSPAMERYGEGYPAATHIVMRGNKTDGYLVQGTIEEVVTKLNMGEKQ